MSTPSQTVGPYYEIGLCDRPAHEVVPGGPVQVEGRVLDGAGEPVPDAMVEIWQADASGEHRADFGWGRCGTDGDGRYRFVTIKPGPVAGQAPHLTMLVFARGLLKPVHTRLYFPDEADANAADTVLASVLPETRATLVAVPDRDTLRFDVRLQGDDQTVFFGL